MADSKARQSQTLHLLYQGEEEEANRGPWRKEKEIREESGTAIG
jgi:hypothetical protein